MADLAALARPLARRLAQRLRRGTLVVDDPQGPWRAGHGQPEVQVTVHDPRAYQAWLTRTSVGFAQSYVAGWWDTADLTGLVRLLAGNLATPLRWLDRFGELTDRPVSLWRRARPPSPATDRHNVRAHYDLPVELFEAMLDESMAYSCAIFEKPELSLADAQLAKFDRICAKLELTPADHLVEIGSGWGGFAVHAAQVSGCRVTTTTVSQSQFEVATQRVAEAGLADRVTVLDADYRELRGTYDRLVSIEMIEAVDWRRHDEFFATCERLLAPTGRMVLQAIVIADRSYARAKHREEFIRRMIFPGGCIPSIAAICESLARATDLRVVDLEDIGRHYAATLRRWYENLQPRWQDLERRGVDHRLRRLFELYLCYCEAAFLERHISDVQMVLAGPAWRPELSLRSR